MSRYSAGEIADADRLVTEMRQAGRKLTPAEYTFCELALRQACITKMNRAEAVRAFAGPTRRAVLDDVPTLESIYQRFGITDPWDTPAARAEQADHDRAMAHIEGLEEIRNAEALAELAPREPHGDNGLMRTDPRAWIESLKSEAATADLAEITRMADEPDDSADDSNAYLREEMTRLADKPDTGGTVSGTDAYRAGLSRRR